MSKLNLTICFLAFSYYCFSQNLPSTFDLRNVNGINYVTSVKYQQGGTCWTHGAMAAMEGNLLMTGTWLQAGEQGEPNLAEYHLDWWNGFNQHNNDDINPSTGSGLVVHNGGDYRVTAAYLSRGEGAVRDIDAQLFDIPPSRTDTSYHYFYPNHIEWYANGKSTDERIRLIKQKVMQYGVMGTCMCVGGFWSGNIHYQPETDLNEPNHAVAIIGWDDNLHTNAELPGAWLCKNSWGTNWGNNGYFWISYYDKHCGKESFMGAVSFYNVEPMQYDYIYYHDYHGWRDELTFCNEAVYKFISQQFEKIKAVSFFTANDSISFNVIITKHFNNNGIIDTLNLKSGFVNHRGFHTIILDSLVYVSPGDTINLYCFLSKGGHPYDKTSEVPVLLGSSSRTVVTSTSKPNQSFYKDVDGIWKDLYNYDTSANFCLKVLTQKLLPDTCSNLEGDTSLCIGQSVSIYSISKVKYASDYLWALQPAIAGTIVNSDTSAIVNWNPIYTGNVIISVKAVNSWGSSVVSELSVIIHALPDVNLGNDTLISTTQSLILTPGSQFINYIWSTGSTDSILIINANLYNQGLYNFNVYVTDSNFCSSTDSISVEIIDNSGVTQDDKNFDFYLIPNPATENCKLIINMLNDGKVNISINDEYYRTIRIIEKKLFKGENLVAIDLHGFNKGIYYVYLNFKNKYLFKKLLIR